MTRKRASLRELFWTSASDLSTDQLIEQAESLVVSSRESRLGPFARLRGILNRRDILLLPMLIVCAVLVITWLKAENRAAEAQAANEDAQDLKQQIIAMFRVNLEHANTMLELGEIDEAIADWRLRSTMIDGNEAALGMDEEEILRENMRRDILLHVIEELGYGTIHEAYESLIVERE